MCIYVYLCIWYPQFELPSSPYCIYSLNCFLGKKEREEKKNIWTGDVVVDVVVAVGLSESKSQEKKGETTAEPVQGPRLEAGDQMATAI